MRIIDAAEILIGQHGIDGVSLLQIAKQAGQSNKYAVQYHFGSKENLLRAIFDTRLTRIGERRRKRLDALQADSAITIRNLLGALIFPVYEEVAADGLHHYALFATRVLDSPLAEETWYKAENFATAAEVKERLSKLTPHLSTAEFDLRLQLVAEMLTRALAIIDRAATSSGPRKSRATGEQILETAIDIAAAALQAVR